MAKKDKELRYGMRINIAVAILTSPELLCYRKVVEAAHTIKALTFQDPETNAKEDLVTLLQEARIESRNGYRSLGEQEKRAVVESRIKQVGEILDADTELAHLDDAKIFLSTVTSLEKIYNVTQRRVYEDVRREHLAA